MFEKMKEMIAEQLNCEEDGITMETSFKEDLGADSLDLFELVMSMEDEFGVEIPSEELEQLTTVGAVVEYLKGKGVEA
ncbi:MAG: acyl carrier protein [Firmicutes bacterium]|nr:acyl carrier protein [Lachnospiraceae bacterium]MDD6066989.1 acyl carrier protein [Bacillota bacterium]MDY2818928.1 acyl carrier protein [Hominisplanchenecus sp.]